MIELQVNVVALRCSLLPLYHDRDQKVLLYLLERKVANNVVGPLALGFGDTFTDSKLLWCFETYSLCRVD
jgi:hypothetical protein